MALSDTIKDPNKRLSIMVNPEKHGYIECSDCSGYGGTIRNSDVALQEICDTCEGDGVIPKPKGNDGTTCSILEEMGVNAPEKDEAEVIYDESGFSSGAGVK